MADEIKPTTPTAAPQPDLLAALESKLSALDPVARKNYFYKNTTADDVKALNLLCRQVDSLAGANRKSFFLAHPELEVRYSAGNFVNPTTK